MRKFKLNEAEEDFSQTSHFRVMTIGMFTTTQQPCRDKPQQQDVCSLRSVLGEQGQILFWDQTLRMQVTCVRGVYLFFCACLQKVAERTENPFTKPLARLHSLQPVLIIPRVKS